MLHLKSFHLGASYICNFLIKRKYTITVNVPIGQSKNPYRLGNFSCFCCRLLTFFQNLLFKKIHSGKISVSNSLDPDQDLSNSLDPDQDQHSVSLLNLCMLFILPADFFSSNNFSSKYL